MCSEYSTVMSVIDTQVPEAFNSRSQISYIRALTDIVQPWATSPVYHIQRSVIFLQPRLGFSCKFLVMRLWHNSLSTCTLSSTFRLRLVASILTSSSPCYLHGVPGIALGPVQSVGTLSWECTVQNVWSTSWLFRKVPDGDQLSGRVEFRCLEELDWKEVREYCSMDF
jgi:hypothetical protein